MKRGTILNRELNEAIAAMGHGDYLIVCDAGFPIPESAWRIDLALQKDDPDLETVLSLIAGDFIAENIYLAEEVPQHNAPLYEKVKRLFPKAEIGTLPHQSILTEMAQKAKAIVRTGAFDPWGNIILQSGVDVPRWFDKEGVIAPDYYQDKME